MLRRLTMLLAMALWFALTGAASAIACPNHASATLAPTQEAGNVGADAEMAEALPVERVQQPASEVRAPLWNGMHHADHLGTAYDGDKTCCEHNCGMTTLCAGQCCSGHSVAALSSAENRQLDPRYIMVPSIADLLGLDGARLTVVDRSRSPTLHSLSGYTAGIPRAHRLSRVQRLTI